ncbi:MAG: HEPN domain-containing protein [Acidimicrobiales bacterium]
MAEIAPTEEPRHRWLRWADEDLVAAGHSAADAEIAPRVACGLAQQAGEKAIKALHVAADVDPPKSHNLMHLARMLTEERASLLLEIDLEELTRWAIEGRYPEDLDEASTNDATRAVELATQVTALAHRAFEKEDAGGSQ